jgi:hypothetical protein
MPSVTRLLGRLALRIGIRLAHWSLDERLAAGFEPDGDPALRARAVQLCSRGHRRRLAASVERLAQRSGDGPPRGMTSAVPIAREQVAEARDSLLELAALLRDGGTVRPRGLAMTRRLLTDTDSFVYTRCAGGVVELQVQAVLRALKKAPDEEGAAQSAAPLGGSDPASRWEREAAQV